MYTGRLIFSQLMDHLPMPTFRRCVERYQGDRWVKSFRCVEHYRCMAFAQLTYRESLRDIEACLRAQGAKLYHMGIRPRAPCRAAPWPMPTNNAIGASTPTSPNASSTRPAAFMWTTPWPWNSTRPSMPSTPQPSICVSRSLLSGKIQTMTV